MNEIEIVISKKPHLSKNSIRSYTTAYNKLLELLAVDSIADADNSEIIDEVDTIDNYGSQSLLLTIAMMIKSDKDLDYRALLKHRELVKIDLKEQKWVNKEEKLEQLPSVKLLTKHLNQQYAQDNYRSYIINFLLIHFNVRNLDMNLVVTDNIKEYRALGKSGDDNVLFAGKNASCYFYRNKYKTKNTYGEKLITISNAKLNRVLKAYIKKQNFFYAGPAFLMARDDGTRIDIESMSHYVTKYTYQGLTETSYNKIIVTETIKDIDDYPKLKKISFNRGTAIETLIEEYGLNVKL